jgi:acetylornithine deacetylase/succinyl-diaminopimelate desuccinylase-like protein
VGMSAERDQTALDLVARHEGDLLRFAMALIAAPSPSPPGDQRAAARVAQTELEHLGLGEVEVVAAVAERPNVLCRWDTGRPGPTLILNGHLDTKPPGDLRDWTADPYCPAVREGNLYGLGAADMKGPIAALTYGLHAAARAADRTLRGSVLLALTADEEGEAQDGVRYLVEDLGLRGDAVLIAEPCGISRYWEMLPLVSRGFGGARFVVRGTPMHSSVSDRVPCVNASVVASRLLLHLHERLTLRCPPGPPYRSLPTVVVGTTMQSGQGLAMVPGLAEFTANLRTVPGMTRDGVAEDIERCLNGFRGLHPDAAVEWGFVGGPLAWTTPTEIAPDEPLVAAVQQATERVLGASPPLGTFPGGTDAIWWQGAAGIPTIPAFGPGLLPNCHRPDEHVATAELTRAAMIYALTVLRYLRED